MEKLYELHWRPFEEPGWALNQRQGRLLRPKLTVFLNQYLTMTTGRDVPAELVFTRFREWAQESTLDTATLMAELFRYGASYNRITAPEQPNTPEGTFLANRPVIDVSTVLPVLMWLFDAVDEADRAGAIATLDSYLVRRLVSRQTSKNYNRMFLELLVTLRQSGDPGTVERFLLAQESDSGFWPSDADMIEVLATAPLYGKLNKGQIRLVLAGIDDQLTTNRSERILHTRP